MGAPYIYDISRLRVKDLHSATYIYVVRRLRVKDAYKVSYLLDRFMQMHETGKFGICDLVSLLYLPFVKYYILE